MPLHAVVAGATGLVGASLVAQLGDDEVFGDTTLVARRAVPDAPPNARQVVLDLAGIRAADLPSRIDAAFCALGTTAKKAGSQDAFRHVDHDMVLSFARAAHERGARSIHVVSAMGADPQSRVFYNRVKGEVERELRGLGAPSVYAYRPALLLGARQELRPAERVGIAVSRALGPLLPPKYRGVPADAVARAMIRDAHAPTPGFHVVESDEIARRGGA